MTHRQVIRQILKRLLKFYLIVQGLALTLWLPGRFEGDVVALFVMWMFILFVIWEV